MKIAVISYPRTASTLLGKSLAEIHKLQYVGEAITRQYFGIFDNRRIASLDELNTQDNYVIKYMGFNFVDGYEYKSGDIDDIRWEMYDKIYATSRESLADACISTKMATVTGQWMKYVNKNTPIVSVDDDHITGFIRGISKFKEILSYLDDHGIKYCKLEYSEIIKLYSFCSPTMKASNINYKEQCANYSEVVAKFKEFDIRGY
jgi:LPS sulfotransferase NodH